MKRYLRLAVSVALLSLFQVCTPQTAFADELPGFPQYFIGVDSRTEVTYRQNPEDTAVTLPNPNLNRLTFLYAHTFNPPTSNHYHGIGAYSYTGPTAAPLVQDTNSGNRIPEVYQRMAGMPPLFLKRGSGINAARYISGLDTSNEYEGLETASTQMLNVPDNIAAFTLFNSSAGRWTTSLGEAIVGLELVNITPGLNISDLTSGTTLFSGPGDIGTVVELGIGDSISFNPLFSVADTAAHGENFSATFRLRDLRTAGGFGEGGQFGFDFQVNAAAPEPSSVSLLVLAGMGLIAGFRARRK